ncbi:MAG TPA: hypothetical protein VE526_06785, partial [Solirubrobacteraceae bacterium]|nr:hypothetical protein [Solirubrobacteraceae bacterium]
AAQPSEGGRGGDPVASPPGPRDRRAVARARCPAGLDACRAATGRVLYVEAVDPDGDGDAHFVLAGGRITAPGISTIAVRRELRPRRLPRVGDWISAAGVASGAAASPPARAGSPRAPPAGAAGSPPPHPARSAAKRTANRRIGGEVSQDPLTLT